MSRRLLLMGLLVSAACPSNTTPTSGRQPAPVATAVAPTAQPARERTALHVTQNGNGYAVRVDSCDHPGTSIEVSRLEEYRFTGDGRVGGKCKVDVDLSLNLWPGRGEGAGVELGQRCPPHWAGDHFRVVATHGSHWTAAVFVVNADGSLVQLSPGC